MSLLERNVLPHPDQCQHHGARLKNARFWDTDWTLAMDGGLLEGWMSRNAVSKSASQQERVEMGFET